MNVVNAWNKLLEVFASHCFIQSFVFDDKIKELSTFHELHDKIQIFFSFDNLINLNHIGVMQLLENFNFSTNPLDIFFVLDPRFFKNFDRNL